MYVVQLKLNAVTYTESATTLSNNFSCGMSFNM